MPQGAAQRLRPGWDGSDGRIRAGRDEEAGLLAQESRGRPLVDDAPALAPAARPEHNQVIGRIDHGRIVLDDDDRVARLGHAPQHGEHPLRVDRV